MFTLVFDREAYEPKWFSKLWEEYRVAVKTANLIKSFSNNSIPNLIGSEVDFETNIFLLEIQQV
jgi:hypothetical protein